MLPGNNQSASRIRQLQFITFTVRLILEIYRRNDSKISNKTETGLPHYILSAMIDKLTPYMKNDPSRHGSGSPKMKNDPSVMQQFAFHSVVSNTET